VHGIIGNTDSIAVGLKLAKDTDGKSVDQKFDLVLTYEYENLSTPISETAVKLKQQLKDVGLHDADDSICGVADNRTSPPKKETVIFHHLNYFASEAGLKAMAHVNW